MPLLAVTLTHSCFYSSKVIIHLQFHFLRANFLSLYSFPSHKCPNNFQISVHFPTHSLTNSETFNPVHDSINLQISCLNSMPQHCLNVYSLNVYFVPALNIQLYLLLDIAHALKHKLHHNFFPELCDLPSLLSFPTISQ